MKTFKNKLFTKRNYECVNVVFCTSKEAPNENWIECKDWDIEVAKCIHLYTENGVRYYGYI